MMYLEPLKLNCPHCQHPIECRVAWIRKKGRKCPACGDSLQALREEIERPLIEFGTMIEDIERVMEVEDEFGIGEVSDVEAQPLRTFGDAHQFLLTRLAATGHVDIDRDEVWSRLCEAINRIRGSKKVRLRKPTDPFIRSNLVSEAPAPA
jgi:hypothetical protein